MDVGITQEGKGVVPIPKFKRRSVSAVRDWPPGCGPAAEQESKQIAVVSLSDSIGIESVVLQVIRCVVSLSFSGIYVILACVVYVLYMC